MSNVTTVTTAAILWLAAAFLALHADGHLMGMHASLTEQENQMMDNGTFLYNALSSRRKVALFKEYEITYARKYPTPRIRNLKFEQFKETLKSVDKLNSAQKADSGTTVFGINVMSDLSPEEFKLAYLGILQPERPTRSLATIAAMNPYRGVTAVDWRGILTTPVKNQGGCSSCWAYVAIAEIESASIKAGLLTPNEALSVQQLLECTYTPPTCEGGRIFEAYTYVREISGGITLDSTYPFNASISTCEDTKHNYTVTLGYDVHVPDEQAMVNHVLMGGTLSALIDASTFGSYRSGIYSGCGSDLTINHAVQIVGVDVPGGFWILRNSWGTNWGDNGYMKLALGSNMCDIAYVASYVVAKPAKKPKQPSYKPTPFPTSTYEPSRNPVTAPPNQRKTNYPVLDWDMFLDPPSSQPTGVQSSVPTYPTEKTSQPTLPPTGTPSSSPTMLTFSARTRPPTSHPTTFSTSTPSLSPTKPSKAPSQSPTRRPSMASPSRKPTVSPTAKGRRIGPRN